MTTAKTMPSILNELLPRYAAMSEDERERLNAEATRQEKERAAAQERARLDKRYRQLRAMQAPVAECLDIDVQPSEPMRLLHQALEAHRQHGGKRGLCLVLSGPNGRGKSTAAVQALYRDAGRPWYATAHQLMLWQGERHQQPAPEWRGQFYVLDQLGHERSGDKLQELFTHVLRTGAILVATTDLAPPAFRADPRYAGHIVSRVDEPRPGLPHGGLLHCMGRDWRAG